MGEQAARRRSADLGRVEMFRVASGAFRLLAGLAAGFRFSCPGWGLAIGWFAGWVPGMAFEEREHPLMDASRTAFSQPLRL